MMLRFSGLLLRLVDYEKHFDIPAPTLGDALAEVERRHPALRPVLHAGDGQLRRTHRVFINGELATDAELTTPLADTDDVEFLTAIAGG